MSAHTKGTALILIGSSRRARSARIGERFYSVCLLHFTPFYPVLLHFWSTLLSILTLTDPPSPPVRWARHNGCTTGSGYDWQEEQLTELTFRYSWPAACPIESAGETVFYKVRDFGHVWPGALGESRSGIDASELMWRFFGLSLAQRHNVMTYNNLSVVIKLDDDGATLVRTAPRPMVPVSLTVFGLRPLNLTGLTNKNTGDAAGDLFFFLTDRFVAPFACRVTKGKWWACKEQGTLAHDSVYTKTILEVDGTWPNSTAAGTCRCCLLCIYMPVIDRSLE